MESKNKNIVIVQGANFGSEAKGAVAHALAQRLGVKWAVRTGSINAGHTIVVDGKKIAFQQLPTAAVLPDVNVVIGPGAYIHEDTLRREISISRCGDRLFLDRNCGVHLDSFGTEAKEAGRSLKIGATGKGCAEAIIHKIRDRGVGVPLLFRDYENGKYAHLAKHDTAEILTDAHQRGDKILIEGTQGSLLDFHCGPYPFVTSRQTTAAAWVAESGLSPALNYEIVLVARTYPIRVAGNSGPMTMETSWPVLARRINERLRDRSLPELVKESAINAFVDEYHAVRREWKQRGASESEISLGAATEALAMMDTEDRDEVLKLFETTTVTRRLRRIAELDREQLRLTVKKEAPAYLALTFLNYEFPELAPAHNPERKLHAEALRYLADLQRDISCQIRYTSLGSLPEDLVEVEV